MQAQLDQDKYTEADLVSIKVPLHLPYGPNSQNFERVEGNIDIHGISYQYVKRRIYNDTLELMCISNTAKTSIKNARDEFGKLANDFVNFSSTKKTTGTHSHNVKFSVQDFTSDHCFDMHQAAFYTYHNYAVASFTGHSFNYLQRLEKPPEA